MVSEERRQEILENRRTFQRLNREIIEGKRRKETIQVASRDGTQYEIEIHALSELAIAKAAQKTGLSLQDLLKRATGGVPDDKSLAKLQFVDELASTALVGDEQERLTAEELAEILPGPERAKVFKKVLEISGLGPASPQLEKFHPEPPK
jgi:hypothetical protein